MTAIQYIKQELSVRDIPFTKDWKTLSDSEKSELKEYAVAEMKLLGIATDWFANQKTRWLIPSGLFFYLAKGGYCEVFWYYSLRPR